MQANFISIYLLIKLDTMKVDKFFTAYATEHSCKLYFKQQREAAGIICRRCACQSHYWIEGLNRWQCKKCRHSTTLKSGTVMENSNLGYRIWLWSLYFMSLTKKGFSALEIKRLVGHKRYEPWGLMQKIRATMGHRDDKYLLDGFMEMDKGFFEGHRKKEVEEGFITKPAKELDRQVKAIVAVSTTPIVTGEYKKDRPVTRPGYLKMSVVQSLSKRIVRGEFDTAGAMLINLPACWANSFFAPVIIAGWVYVMFGAIMAYRFSTFYTRCYMLAHDGRLIQFFVAHRPKGQHLLLFQKHGVRREDTLQLLIQNHELNIKIVD
jgi:hypothetical protein